MKRKSRLIEVYEDIDHVESVEKKTKAISINISCESDEPSSKMYKDTIWYKSLLAAEKTCMKDNTIKKIHYKFEDEREMVEEYNIDTKVLLRRAWKLKGKLGGEGKWYVEVGDPIPEPASHGDGIEIVESKDQPLVTRRNTRVNLEWRIRNLPYPIETYSVTADNDAKCLTVRTTNKKYYKKLGVPELERLNLPMNQGNIQLSHSFNTLIISYKKPQQLLEMDKDWYEQLKEVKPAVKDVPNDCKTQ